MTFKSIFRQALIVWYVFIIIPRAFVVILKEMINMKKQSNCTFQQIILAQAATIQELEKTKE